MKLLFISLLFLFQAFSYPFESIDSTQNEVRNPYPSNAITADALYLVFGTFNFGYEATIINKLSAYGNIGFGQFWFTELNSMYEVGFKYMLDQIFHNSFYASISYQRMAIEYNKKSADVKSFGILGGYKFYQFNPFYIDVSGGLYFSSQNQITFEEKSGSLTKSISVGGVNYGANVRVGFAF